MQPTSEPLNPKALALSRQYLEDKMLAYAFQFFDRDGEGAPAWVDGLEFGSWLAWLGFFWACRASGPTQGCLR